jgi:hypothetical protein
MSTDESFAEVFNGGKLVGETIGYLDGVIAERERIIALLEAELNKCDCEEPLQHLSALIKGETS